MTKPAVFTVGLFTGIILMQIGHALYLHSGHYVAAMFITVFVALLVCPMVNDCSE